jgi:hypothetical protein
MKFPPVKLPSLNPYYKAALVLTAAAVLLLAVAIVTDRRDLTSAALVIAGLACLITGIFLAAFSGPDPLDTRLVSLLPVQGTITLARVCADLGITGNAVFLPPSAGRDRVMQFVPVSVFSGDAAIVQGEPFVAPPGPAGLLAVPAGAPLLEELRARHNLAIPEDPAVIPDLVREVIVDLLEVAERAVTEVNDATVSVRMEGYRLHPGCVALGHESPRCCLVSPCPVCSLVACLLVETTGRTVQVERCSPGDKDPATVTISFTLGDRVTELRGYPE